MRFNEAELAIRIPVWHALSELLPGETSRTMTTDG